MRIYRPKRKMMLSTLKKQHASSKQGGAVVVLKKLVSLQHKKPSSLSKLKPIRFNF